MKRTIIVIDEEKCNGCGLCVEGCHEGALQLIDGKARLVSELYCDGLGACVGECPVGAITLEEREAEPYDEIATLERMIPKGINTIRAHLKHLFDYNQLEYYTQAVDYLKQKGIHVDLDFDRKDTNDRVKHVHLGHMGGCPGSRAMVIENSDGMISGAEAPSALRQWPVQLHLINPMHSMWEGKDILLAADCVPFALNNFHGKLLSGKMLAIACPKLDDGQDVYLEKLKILIQERNINTITVAIMEVPCCRGLLRLAQEACALANRKVPIKQIIVGIDGKIIKEDWLLFKT